MANTVFSPLTTRSSFTTSPNDKVFSIWIGDSIVAGTNQSPSSEITVDIFPSALTDIAKYWNKWGTKSDGSTGRLNLDDFKAGGGTAGWEDVQLDGGSVSGSLAYVAPYFGTALYFAGSGTADFTPQITHAATLKHHTIVLGISGSSMNDDITTVPSALAHWEPSIDNGAYELLTEHYLQPAIANLQTSSGKPYLDCIYIHVGNDASSVSPAFSAASAQKYDIHMRRLISHIENFLEFPGVPVCIIQTPQLSSSFKWASTIRAAQARIASSRPRTFLINSNQYAQGSDHIHFRAMDCIKLGYDAATLVRSKLPNQWANLTKTF